MIATRIYLHFKRNGVLYGRYKRLLEHFKFPIKQYTQLWSFVCIANAFLTKVVNTALLLLVAFSKYLHAITQHNAGNLAPWTKTQVCYTGTHLENQLKISGNV